MYGYLPCQHPPPRGVVMAGVRTPPCPAPAPGGGSGGEESTPPPGISATTAGS